MLVRPTAEYRGTHHGTGGGGGGGAHHGRAVQIDPIKPKLKPPRYERLELRYDGPLSNAAFKFNLRCYTTVTLYSQSERRNVTQPAAACVTDADGNCALDSLPTVGRCRLTLSNLC
jgi:hypothetical protein